MRASGVVGGAGTEQNCKRAHDMDSSVVIARVKGI